MFNIYSRQQHGYCDGVSRRSFLQVGAMSMGGLTSAALVDAVNLAYEHGVIWLLAGLFAFLSMFRRPFIYLLTRALRLNPERPDGVPRE